MRPPTSRRVLRENWYRDLWLLAITVVVVFAVYKAWDTSSQAKTLTLKFQQQRVTAILYACEDANARNRSTVGALDRLLGPVERHASPARLRLIAQQRASTILLINALSPVRDCERLVRQSAR